MNLFKNKIALLFVLGFTSLINAALPSNISELVETSAPAVVNITSRKEVKMQNSLRGFDEFERFFGIPGVEASLNLNSLKQEKLKRTALASFLKTAIY